jgi:phosphate transport system substrate-binding protein
MKRLFRRIAGLSALFGLMLVGALAAACGDNATPTTTQGEPSGTSTPGGNSTATSTPQNLSGQVQIDGSSTVYPVTEAVAEEFMKINRNVQVTVGISGTGGGFKRFCGGETDISDASRPITDSEIEECANNGVEYVEIPVAYDGLSVMVNPQNDWVTSMTVEELKMIWEPGSTINNWNQVRPEWPNEEIVLVGAGTDSGTFDYFTEVIVDEAKASRADYIASEDDNVLVQAIADSQYALGYFGYAYYVENPGKLKLVAIDEGEGLGPILPSEETISNGSYSPLSRPLFVYVKTTAAQRPEVREFVTYYLSDQGIELAEEVGYIALPDSVYNGVRKRFNEGKTGTVYVESSEGKTLEELFAE